MNKVTRRGFLRCAALGSGGLAWWGAFGGRAWGANDRVRLAVMGTNGRGSDLARSFLAVPGVEFAYVCDVDERAAAKGLQAVRERQSASPKVVLDFRRVLDDGAVDGLVIAAPDHWHGQAAVLACAAGKHVYVEKQACHNPREGELMVAAARRYRRVVQVGTQRRSFPAIIEAIAKVRGGAIGQVRFARGWYNATRGTIGRGKTVTEIGRAHV